MKPLVLLALTSMSACLAAATAAEPRLFEAEPYDRLTLNDKAATVLRLLRLDLPGRMVPKNSDPKSLLRVRLLDRPDLPYEVAWGDVAELRLWEQILLDEARRLVEQRRFVEAFDYFVYLRREYPQLSGLNEVESTSLAAEAEQAIESDRLETAMARLLQLQQRNRLHPQLAELYGQVTKQLVQRDLKSDRPRAARLAVERLTRQFPNHAEAAALQAALAKAAEMKLTLARTALDEKRYVAAADAAQSAAQLAGDSSSALDVYRRAVEAHPRLTVGVVETARADRPQAVPSWASRRLAPLDHKPTLELTIRSGTALRTTYEGDANRWEADERDPLRFRLHLGDGPFVPSASDAAAMLADAARPAGLGLDLRVVNPRLLQLDFARRHPRPEAWAADVLATSSIEIVGAPLRPAPYAIVAVADGTVIRSRCDSDAGGPAEIVERRFVDEEATAAALVAGEIDVVDRIAPWQTEDLADIRELKLVRYAVPSVHLLLFNGANPRLQRSELRRAVGYAIDRESILRNHLQPPRSDPSARTIDGVFPQGRATDDPLGYAYDATGASRPYDPARAFLLAKLTDGAPTTVEPLILTHPATATAAKACRRIAAYLRQIGLAVELRPAAVDDAPTSADAADLTYVVVSSTEPLMDVSRWLGSRDGLVNLDSRALATAVTQAAQAESFAAARAALFEVQRVLHDEALVVPLWQLPEHAVWRSRAVPPADLMPTSLYQQVDRLRVLPHFNEALP